MNEQLLKAFELIESSLTGDDQAIVDEVTQKLGSYSGDSSKEIKLDDVKTFLSENDAGKEYYTNTLTNTKKEAVSEYLSSEDYKSSIDKVIKEAVEKKEADLRKELNTELTPEQKRIKELEDKHAETEAKLRMKDISLEAGSLLQEHKLHKDMLDFVIDPSSVDNTKSNIKKMASLIDNMVKQGVEAEFKKIGRDPQKGGSQSTQKVTAKMLEDLATKAKNSGRIEDRVKYSEMKRLYNAQQLK